MKKLIFLLSFLYVGSIAYGQSCCPNCPLFLPDGASAEFPIGVADNGDNDGDSTDDCASMVLESIAISFDHEYLGDLSLIVTSPCGNTITLLGPVGFFGPTDGTTWDITFVDGTPTPDPGFSAVFNNSDPWGLGGMYTGSYNPNVGNIADLNCPDNCGTWTFFVSDDQGIDVGNFLDFNLNFGQPTMDGEIACTSEPCTIDAVEITNVVCGDNGTPGGSDDVYTFDLMATATQGTTFSDDQGNTGLAYGTVISYGPYPISGGDVTVNITDDGDVACIGSAIAVAPPPCPTPSTGEVESTRPCICFGDVTNVDTDGDGESDIFGETLTITTTPAQAGITDWGFGPGATGTFYDATGAVTTMPSVVDNGDGTYTVTVYTASGETYTTDFTSAAANDGDGITTAGTVTGGGCEFCPNIPTVGEWGLIILCLSMLITAVVGIRQRQVTIARERA